MKKILFLLIGILVIWGCKEVFESPAKSPKTGYLVVEGAINSGQGATIITLSRTSSLENKKKIFETGAQVTIEGADKSTYLLKETAKGQYVAENLNLNRSQKYQLKINTGNGEKYKSDFVPVLKNPPIDSVSWESENNGIQLYINTHDPQNNTHYYQWESIETWEYHADKTSAVKYEITSPSFGQEIYKAVYRFPKTPGVFDSSLFFCWQSNANTNLLLGSTAKLDKDLIYLPIAYIPSASDQLSVLYSIYVRQISWSKEGYEFLEKIKKNTEKTGSIFDAQPSEINGNIYCISDPAKPVIGFVTICPIQEKRLFLKNKTFPNWGYKPLYCSQDTLNNTNKFIVDKKGTALIPTQNGPCLGCEATDIKIFYASAPICVDCKLRGGSSIRPSFWPK